MVFGLSCMVVVLHLDNSTAKHFFLSKLVCYMSNLAGKHGITLIPACILIHLNVEVDCLWLGRLVPNWHLLLHVAQAKSHLWGPPEVDLMASSPLETMGWKLSPILGHIRWVVYFHFQPKFPWFYPSSWQNISQVNSDFVRCCVDKGSVPQSVRWWWLKHLQQKFTNNAEKDGPAGVLMRQYQMMTFLLLN